MEATPENVITRVLRAAASGDVQAAADLLPLVYQELRNLARSRLAKLPPGQTLQTTALVHEAYLRVVGDADPGWEHRGHFFSAAARAMRNILVDQARRKASLKRGGDRRRVGLDESELAIEPPSVDVVALDEALTRLEAEDPRKAQIVDLRYFAGLTEEQTGAALGVTVGVIKHEWRYTRRWLYHQLNGENRNSIAGEPDGG